MCLSTPLRAAKSQSALLLPASSSNQMSLQAALQSDTLPSRDEAIQMILSSRWWCPSMGASLPLASLLSHNAVQEKGWLKCLLFPSTGPNDTSIFDEKLTLSYLLIIAEADLLADKLAEAWGETEESTKAIAKNTIARFAYHPILENFPLEYHESTEPVTYLFSLFPSGCLGSIDKDAGKLALVFLDAALFRRGRCHSNSVKRLFINCDGATIGRIRNSFVGALFHQSADFESLPSKSPTNSKHSVIKASRQAVANRIPLAAVNKEPIQPRALKKGRRLKRQHSMSLLSQKNKKKTKPEGSFWEWPATGSKEN